MVLNDDGSVSFRGELTIDADGSPHAYHPKGCPPGLDYLANAGRPGNWWGIATNKSGTPFVQGVNHPAPGFYVSTTSYKVPGFTHGDPRRELDSERVPFIVIPSPLIKAVWPAVIGCKALLVDTKTKKQVACVVGDVGPAKHLGEASIFAAKAIGIPSDPKRGGSSEHRFNYVIWPGVPAPGFVLQPRPSKVARASIAAIADVDYAEILNSVEGAA